MTRISKAETKPFWMDDADWERKYPPMPESNISDQVLSGIPELVEVEKGDLVGAYTFKDNLLVYHFYKKDRKKIFDEAYRAMDNIADTEDPTQRARVQNELAKKANEELSKAPWWVDFDKKLSEVFQEVFKYQEHKATFYPEVDSWSVILPAPSGITKPSKQQLEKPFSMLSLRVGGK